MSNGLDTIVARALIVLMAIGVASIPMGLLREFGWAEIELTHFAARMGIVVPMIAASLAGLLPLGDRRPRTLSTLLLFPLPLVAIPPLLVWLLSSGGWFAAVAACLAVIWSLTSWTPFSVEQGLKALRILAALFFLTLCLGHGIPWLSRGRAVDRAKAYCVSSVAFIEHLAREQGRYPTGEEYYAVWF